MSPSELAAAGVVVLKEARLLASARATPLAAVEHGRSAMSALNRSSVSAKWLPRLLRARVWCIVVLVLCTWGVPPAAGASEPDPVLLAGGPKLRAPKSKKPEVNGTSKHKGASQQSRSKTGPPYDTQTRQQLEKSKRSYEKLIREHEQKLADYRKNPLAYDNEGRLQGQPPEIQKQIIQGRIEKLQEQLARQRDEMRKIEETLRALPEGE